MKSVLLALTGVLALSASALGQTVTTEKKAEKKTFVDNLYSSVDMRQYFETKYEGENRTEGRKYQQSRIYVGTKMLNDMLDVYALFRLEHHEHSTNIETRGPVLVGRYTPVTGSWGSLGLYSENYMKGHDQASTASYTGLQYTTPDYEKETILGTLSLGGDLTPNILIDGSTQKVELIERDRNAFMAAAKTETAETKKEEMSYAVWATAYAKLEIAGVKGLKVSYAPEYYRSYDPTYKYDAAATDLATFDGYDMSQTTYHYFGLSYAMTEKATISNTFGIVAEGLADAPADGLRYLDWVKVSYKVQ